MPTQNNGMPQNRPIGRAIDIGKRDLHTSSGTRTIITQGGADKITGRGVRNMTVSPTDPALTYTAEDGDVWIKIIQ
jgi:hypothetical protein